MKLTLSTNLIFQALAFVVQFGNLMLDMTHGKTQAGIALAVSLAQAGLAWKAHLSNPDGSAVPASK